MSEEKKVRRWIGSSVLVLIGVALGAGVVLLSRPSTPSAPPVTSTAAPGIQVWTCSMHSQIRMSKPGKCPICGMDLVLVSAGGGEAGADGGAHLTLSAHARSMARVETSTVELRELWKEIRTVGKVALDETAVAYITARVDGRVDVVFANFPGTHVNAGDHLASIYSPDLFTTQEEFLIASRQGAEQEKLGRGTSNTSGARRRLQLWGVTDAQIDALAKSGKAETHLTVFSPRGGTVIEKAIRAGQYVKTGDHLYTVASLSQVWLVVEVYESDLSWVRFGQSVSVALEDDAARSVTGTVSFVEPLLNEPTRTVRVLVILENASGRLKPGMFAQALIRIPITPEGAPGPTGLEGKYACRMHPYVVSATAAACTICGMALDLVPGDPAKAAGALQVLTVPAEAVLTTGKRTQIVQRHSGPAP